MAPVLPDLRLALRQMASRPGFTAAAVLTLALGIGASTAMFSVVDAVLLEPLSYEDSRRLVVVWNSLTESGEVTPSEPEVVDYREGVRSFDRLAAYRPAEVNLTGDAGAERVSAARASADVFPVLGRAPILGRIFAAEEDRPDRDDVAVLGYGLWKRRFGGDPAAVGRRIEVDGVARTVLGVMPEGFKLPMDFGSDPPTELWLPLALDPKNTGGRGRHFLRAVARLAPGATVAQANAELEGITRRWVEEGVVRDERVSAYVVPVHEAVVGEVRPALLVLFAAVGLVLLIACANVAGLLLARVEERHREVAVRGPAQGRWTGRHEWPATARPPRPGRGAGGARGGPGHRRRAPAAELLRDAAGRARLRPGDLSPRAPRDPGRPHRRLAAGVRPAATLPRASFRGFVGGPSSWDDGSAPSPPRRRWTRRRRGEPM